MGRIPVYDELQVAPQAPPQARVQLNVHPDQFGANVGRAAAGMGADMLKLGVKMQEEEDAQLVLDVANRYKQDLATALHDPEQGIFSLKGSNARNVSGEYQTVIKALNEQYGKELTSERQRQAFAKYMMPHVQSMREAVSRHERDQWNAYKEQNATASLAVNADMAVKAYTDPTVIANVIRDSDNVIRMQWGHLGEAIVQAKQLEQRQKVYAGVFDQFLKTKDSGKAAIARDYYNTIKDDIPSAIQPIIEAKLQEREDLDWEQSYADRLATKFVRTDGLLDEEAAYRDVKSITDPVKRQKAERSIGVVRSRLHAIKTQKDNDATNAVLANFESYSSEAEVKSAALAVGLDSRHAANLAAAWRSNKIKEKMDARPELLKEIDDRILNGDIADKAQLWRDYGGQLSYEIISKFADRIDNLGKDLLKSKPIVDMAKKKNIYNNPEKFAQYQDWILEEIKDFKIKNKRNPSQKDLTGIAIKAFVDTDDSWFRNVPAYTQPRQAGSTRTRSGKQAERID